MVDFKPGDVVQLKSGGPLMTVSTVCGEVLTCEWFDDRQQVLVRAFAAVLLNQSCDSPLLNHSIDSPPRERKKPAAETRRASKTKEEAVNPVSNGGVPAL
jgi:uncharacterized protein YodC (DUF2158 family)